MFDIVLNTPLIMLSNQRQSITTVHYFRPENFKNTENIHVGIATKRVIKQLFEKDEITGTSF